MSTTVTYKGSTLTTVDNQTRTLKTAGKYMEGDVILTDVTEGGGGGYVTQDQDGFIVLPPDGGGSPSVGGLEYETGTWIPSEDIDTYVISFTNTHTVAPFYYMIADAGSDYYSVNNSNFFLLYCNYHQLLGNPIYESSSTIHYGEVRTMYRAGSATSFVNGTTSLTTPYTDNSSFFTTDSRYWATETGIKAYTNSDSRYWRAGRTYKWIAIWAPTT